MSKKIMWFDCETTGLDPAKNGIVQLSILIEEDGKVVDMFSSHMKPFDGCEYDAKALEINGLKKEDIRKFVPEATVFKALQTFFARNVDYKKRGVNLTPAGYNVRFDVGFLQALFVRNTKVHYGAVVNYYDDDTFGLVKTLVSAGKIRNYENLKLGTMCAYHGIKLKNAHDSLADIKATRKLHKKLVKAYLKK